MRRGVRWRPRMDTSLEGTCAIPSEPDAEDDREMREGRCALDSVHGPLSLRQMRGGCGELVLVLRFRIWNRWQVPGSLRLAFEVAAQRSCLGEQGQIEVRALPHREQLLDARPCLLRFSQTLMR